MSTRYRTVIRSIIVEPQFTLRRRSIPELDLSRGRGESSEVWDSKFPKGTRNRLAGNPQKREKDPRTMNKKPVPGVEIAWGQVTWSRGQSWRPIDMRWLEPLVRCDPKAMKAPEAVALTTTRVETKAGDRAPEAMDCNDRDPGKSGVQTQFMGV